MNFTNWILLFCFQMAIGMMLSIIVEDHIPPLEVVDMWLQVGNLLFVRLSNHIIATSF
jgi:hypothetical protein